MEEEDASDGDGNWFGGVWAGNCVSESELAGPEMDCEGAGCKERGCVNMDPIISLLFW